MSGRAPRELGPDDDPAEVARAVCLDQLSHRARTRAELDAALAARGVPPDVAAQVLDRFAEVGLVDDAAFAQAWVIRRSVSKGLSRRALSDELRRRGLADPEVGEAVAGLAPEDEAAHARALLARRLGPTAGLDPAVRRRRLVALLARKGYPAGQAYALVSEALTSEAEASGAEASGAETSEAEASGVGRSSPDDDRDAPEQD